MTTKEKLITEIDGLPEEILSKVLKFIESLKTKPVKKKKLPSFRLKGQFDDADLRKKAYE